MKITIDTESKKCVVHGNASFSELTAFISKVDPELANQYLITCNGVSFDDTVKWTDIENAIALTDGNTCPDITFFNGKRIEFR